MKTKLLCLLFSVLLIGFSAICQTKNGPLNNAFIKTTVEHASYNFSNEAMYWNEEQWVGKSVCVTGSFFNLRKSILHTNRRYEEFSGRNSNGESVNFIVFFDAGSASGDQYRDTTQSAITNLSTVWVFGTVQKCVQAVSRNGTLKLIPVIDLQLVFRKDDYNFSHPIYIAPEFRY